MSVNIFRKNENNSNGIYKGSRHYKILKLYLLLEQGMGEQLYSSQSSHSSSHPMLGLHNQRRSKMRRILATDRKTTREKLKFQLIPGFRELHENLL